MTAPPSAPVAGVAQASLDRDGLLTAADPAIAALNRLAGGDVGAPLALPSVAAVAGLARRLGILVVRRAVIADQDSDIDLTVRAEPDANGVRLALSDWRRSPAAPLADRPGEPVDLAPGDGWRWESDAALRLIRWSPGAGLTRGVDAVGLLGRPLPEVFVLTGGDGQAALVRRDRFVDQPARLGGTGEAITVSAEPRRDANGRFGGFVGTARLVDPTDDGSSASAGTFTAGLDRALRKPLAQIIANADSITAGGNGPIGNDYTDYAADIAHAGRHLLALVDDLVDLEAVERPDFAPSIDPIDLVDVARRAAGLLAVRAEQAGVVIERPPASATLPARGNFRRALQILVNLIGNAVRYAPRGSIVLVSRHRRDGLALITVSDEGKGIAPVDHGRVFDKFQRVDPSEPGGNGLGLYIARRLARAMNGDLTLDSVPGEGARFTLTLPADPASPAPAAGDQDQR